MAPNDSRCLSFGSFLLDPSRARLLEGDRDIPLRPKTYELLTYLARNAGRVVSKDELFAAVWPGVVVTEDSLVRCIHEIREALADPHHTIVRTVARRGYELAIPVREAATAEKGGSRSHPDSPAVPHAPATPRPPRRRLAIAASLLGVVALSAVVYFGVHAAGRDRLSAPPMSLVVLPLVNLNGDADQEYFAAALSNDLTTDLSRIRDSFVIARYTADSYRGRAAEPSSVGRELGVRYVVDGSVYRKTEDVQVTVRLSESSTGRVLWSQRFEGQRKELGRLQQDAAEGIVHTLRVQMVDADVTRSLRERPRNPDARDLEMRGWALWNRQTPESIEAAREMLQEAIKLDPASGYAWNMLSATYTSDLLNRWLGLRGRTREEWLQRFHDAADRARALNPDPGRPFPSQCTAMLFDRNFEESLACRKQVIDQFPSDPVQHLMASNTLIMLARPGDALAEARQAARLSPRDSRLTNFYGNMSLAHLYLGEHREAVPDAKRAISARPDHAMAYALLAAAATESDDMATAHEAIAQFRHLQPDYTVAKLRTERWSNDPQLKSQSERFYEALLKAGLPE
jgi:TolB-like protein/DNA-binding winged helix-turn-helix (wHTH) protein